MKRILSFIFCLLLIIISLGTVVSCKAVKPLDPVVIENTKEITKIIRDTLYKIEADSSYYEAYIECINGKPGIKESRETVKNSKPGKSLSIPKTILTGHKLTVKCKKPAEELFQQHKEIHIKDTQQIPVYIDKPIYTEKPFTWFQNLQIGLGRVFLGLITSILLFVFLPWKKII